MRRAGARYGKGVSSSGLTAPAKWGTTARTNEWGRRTEKELSSAVAAAPRSLTTSFGSTNVDTLLARFTRAWSVSGRGLEFSVLPERARTRRGYLIGSDT